jgi:hypothetical protein
MGRNKKNISAVLLGYTDTASTDNTALSAAVAGITYVMDTNNLAVDDGAIAINELSAGGGFYFAVKNSDGTYTKSSIINPRRIISMQAADPVDAVGKVVTVSAFENIDCESEYCLKIRYESPVVAQTYGYQDMVKTYSYVTRCCGAACGCPDGAAWDVAMGLAEQITADAESAMNLTNATAQTTMAALVRNSTTVLTTSSYDNDEDWTFTKGSNIITCTTDIDYNNGTDVVAGDFIGVIDTGAAGTISASNATYFRVEAIDDTAKTITLDRPWHLDTVTFSGDGEDLQVLPKATGEAYADSTWSLEIQFADGDDADGIVTYSTPGATDYVKPYVVDGFVSLACGLDCNATVTTSTESVQPEGLGYYLNQLTLDSLRGSKYSPYAGSVITEQFDSSDYHFTNSTGYVTFTIDYLTDGGYAEHSNQNDRAQRVIIGIPNGTSNTEAEITTILTAISDGLGIPFTDNTAD